MPCIYIYVYGVYLYLPYIYIYINTHKHIYICIKYTQYTSRSKRLKSELLLRGHFVFLSFRLHNRTPGYWHRGFRSSWRPLRGALSWRTGQRPGVQERTGEHQGFFAKSTCTYLHLQHSSKENFQCGFLKTGDKNCWIWPGTRTKRLHGPNTPGVYEPAFAYATCPEGNTDPTHLVSFEPWFAMSPVGCCSWGGSFCFKKTYYVSSG